MVSGDVFAGSIGVVEVTPRNAGRSRPTIGQAGLDRRRVGRDHRAGSGFSAVLVDLVGSSYPLEIVATESSWVVRSFLVPRSFAAVAGTSFARHRRATMPPRCRSERSRDGTGFHGLLVGWRGALISGVPAWALWTILAAVFAIGEVLTPGLFFLGPLALAALIAAVVAFAAGGAPGAIAFVAASVAIAPHCRLVASARRDAHGNGYVEFPSCPAMGPAGRPDGCSTPAAANASSLGASSSASPSANSTPS